MKRIAAGLLVMVGALGAGNCFAREAFVCTSIARVTPPLSVGPFLFNATKFNCGTTVQNKTISELAADGWTVSQPLPSFIGQNEVALQFIIQR